MGVTEEVQLKQDVVLPETDNDVFDNANTITQWLLSQPAEARPQLAEAIFQRLLREASQSRQYHGNGHACVRLCSFAQQCAKSTDRGLKEWAFTEKLSVELFHFYLEWYEHDPHRALRLVLDVLVMSSTANPCPETGKAVKKHVLRTLLAIIARKSPRRQIKSGLQCLDHFLNKRVVCLADVFLAYEQVDPSVAGLPSSALWRSFAFQLFSWMELSHLCPLAGKCLVHIFRGLDKAAVSDSSRDLGGFTLELWKQWLQDALSQNSEILEDIKNYVLAPIFKTDRDSSLRLLNVFNESQTLAAANQDLADQKIVLQLSTLELGKKYGLVEEPTSDDGDVSQRSTNVVLQRSVLDRLLAHPSQLVRCSAFSLLISSQATTKPFSEVAFSMLRKHLAAFHADYDAKVRNEVLGYTKNFVKRVKNVITVAQRSLAAQRTTPDAASKKKFGPDVAFKDPQLAKEVLDRHQSFLEWYMNFLKGELLPTASYQRHITAVKAALLVLRAGKHAGITEDVIDEDIAQLISSSSTWIRLLIDLLLDPFDDVRDGAAQLLSLLPPDIAEVNGHVKPDSPPLFDILRNFCDRSSKLSDRTGRADHGDGAARSQGLLCSWLSNKGAQLVVLSDLLERIELKISKAERDLGHAAIENPVHADFAAVSYVWQVLARATYSDDELATLHQSQRRILNFAQRIWATVQHVLCDDSPEGHLPEEFEDIEGLDTKDLLSYSFRAVHESSNLLRLLIGTLRLKKAPGVPFPPFEVFRDTGNLAFEQLATLRHRGAFSTVSYTFTTCCQLTQHLQTAFPESKGSDGLLRQWYQGAINCIMTQASTTRRSAGIPPLVGAVLSANAASPSFDEVYGTLEEIGQKSVRMSETDGSNLPQVHALNSLREIFRSSLLSKKAEGYLARTLHLAATSLKSEVWAIRNCGLLLLRSLIDCLLGTGDSKAAIESGWDGHSVRISYNKYPTLPGVLLGLLRSADGTLDHASQTGAAEAVFPALDIIRRAGPPEENRDELRRYIEGYLGSRLWHVREIAARTLCSFLLKEDWASAIERLLRESAHSTNRLHGTLLTARFLIERKVDLGIDLSSDSVSIESLLKQLARTQDSFNHCAELQAAYLEILNLLSDIGFTQQVAGAILPAAATKGANSAHRDIQTSLRLVYDAANSADANMLRACVLGTLSRDINTTSRILEAITGAGKQLASANTRIGLCGLYLEVCKVSSAPEVRAVALTNLGLVLDDMLTSGDLAELPSCQDLDQLWGQLQRNINPTLSYAITEVSGTIMAALISLDPNNQLGMEQRLRRWGDMITECLDVDNSFDTRYAAAMALKHFFARTKVTAWDAKYLPILSALYDGLIDDDDEVREAAASAASAVTGVCAVAPTAADEFLLWLDKHFGESEEFQSLVVYRMVGQPCTPSRSGCSPNALVPAEDQLRKAMDFDDSLFATEEQNLFIDEVRETARWKRVFERIGVRVNQPAGGEGPFSCLRNWVEKGLVCVIGLAGKEDGPLGWTSDQHVFAVCARVLLCAVAIVRIGEDARIVELLREFGALGKKTRIHGSLLEMASLS